MATDLANRIAFFSMRLQDELREQTALCGKLVERITLIDESKTALERTVGSARGSSPELIRGLAEADQSLAAARDRLQEFEGNRLSLRLTLESLVRALETLNKADHYLRTGQHEAAETVCRALGIL